MKCPACQHENPDNTRFCGLCAAPLLPQEEKSVFQTETLLTPFLELPRGTTFAGRYEIIEALGRGGMGRVFKVFDTKIKEVVALKLLKPEVTDSEKTLARFRDEIRLARKITHKNVCRMYDLGEEQETSFITMEYISGEDLKSMIKMMGPLSAGQAVFIGKQICEGLAAAHRLGIIHRDLKPRNIMVDREGNAKIMDFGIARSMEDKDLTGRKMIIGTPEYMSPERIEGEKADKGSDIYSLGIILYEMVCGRVPFEGDTPLSVAVKQKTQEVPDPKKFNPQIPESLVKVILRCLEKNKEKRYQSVEDVLSELIEIEKGIPTTERILFKERTSFLRDVTRQFKKRKIFIAAVAVLVLVFASVLVWRFLLQKEEAPLPITLPKPSLAVLYFVNNTGDRNLDSWSRSLSNLFIGSFQRSARYITVLNPESIYFILNKLKLDKTNGYSLEDLKRIYLLEKKLTHILTGYFSMAGNNLRIIYDLKEASTGSTIASDWADGQGEKAFHSLVDALAKKVLEDFKIPDQGKAGKLPTTSPLALRYYLQARDSEIKYAMKEELAEFDKGVSYYQKALQEDPNFAMAFWGLGDIYENRFVHTNQKEDYDLMQTYYKKAYSMNPDLAGANAGLGWAYFFKEDFDSAYEYFKRAYELEPANPHINNNVGSFLRSIGLEDKAIKYYSQAIELGDYTLRSHRLRALCYQNVGKYEEAVADARKTLEVEPDNVRTQLDYIRILIMMKKLEEAEKEIAIAKKLDPEDLNHHIQYMQAYILAAKGEKAKTLAIIESAKKADPFYYTYLLSRCYAILGMKDEALQIIRDGIEKGFKKNYDVPYSYKFLVNNYFYDNLRDDPRFIKIVETQKNDFEQKMKKYSQL